MLAEQLRQLFYDKKSESRTKNVRHSSKLLLVAFPAFDPRLGTPAMSRLLFGSLFVLSLALMSLPTRLVQAASDSPPNVLLICIDDLKPTIGCFGDSVAKTPNIDRLSQRGVLFESAYCNQAVCSPSRNALMTGLRPQTLGVYDLETNFRKAAPDAVTVAQHFRAGGYRAEALGKIFHVGHGNVDDVASWDVPLYRSKAKSYNLPTQWKESSGNKPAKGAVTESADVADETYVDGDVALEACRRLNAAAKRDEPFFLAVGFIRPHLPFTAPKKYWDLYDPAELPMPQTNVAPELAPSYAPTGGGELRTYSGVPEKGPIDIKLTRHLIHGYYAATSYTDAQIGLVLDTLDASAAAKDTIIVLWGDHGWHLGDHGQWCKHTNYEQAARIPVIVSAPGLSMGAKTSAMIESVDIYPTLVELAGLDAPKDIDGKSFAAVIRDPQASARSSVVHVYPRGGRLGRAIRTPRYRMVQWKEPGAATETAEFELYDYQTDPLETRNLAGDQPDVVARLQAILATHPEAKPSLLEQLKKTAEPQDKATRTAAFLRRDKDKDGKLTFAEFIATQPDPAAAKARFPKFDKNGDDVLTESEYVGE